MGRPTLGPVNFASANRRIGSENGGTYGNSPIVSAWCQAPRPRTTSPCLRFSNTFHGGLAGVLDALDGLTGQAGRARTR